MEIKELQKLNFKELCEILNKHGVEVPEKATKAQVIENILELEAHKTDCVDSTEAHKNDVQNSKFLAELRRRQAKSSGTCPFKAELDKRMGKVTKNTMAQELEERKKKYRI